MSRLEKIEREWIKIKQTARERERERTRESE